MDYKTQAIIRGICTLILFINAILTAKGINPIPFDENTFTEVATEVVGGLSLLWVWWKDSPITKLAQKKYKEFMKEKKK